jgi:hypothetical protein
MTIVKPSHGNDDRGRGWMGKRPIWKNSWLSNRKLLIWGAIIAAAGISVTRPEYIDRATDAVTLVAIVQPLLDDDRDRENDEKGDRDRS